MVNTDSLSSGTVSGRSRNDCGRSTSRLTRTAVPTRAGAARKTSWYVKSTKPARNCSWIGREPRSRFMIPRGGPVPQAHLLVAVLGASSYTYAEATSDEQLASWIGWSQGCFWPSVGLSAALRHREWTPSRMVHGAVHRPPHRASVRTHSCGQAASRDGLSVLPGG